MEDMVDAAKQRRVRLDVANVRLFEREVRICRMVRQVGGAPADQIVDDTNAIAGRQQRIDHVAADEAGASGDDRGLRPGAHFAPIFFMVRTL